MAKEAKQVETAIDPYAVNLDGSQEMPPPEIISKGWHKFALTDYTMVDKPEESKRYLMLDLQHNETGAPRRAFLNWPMQQDYTMELVNSKTGQPMVDKEGNPMTRAGSKIAAIKLVISALGGPETGVMTPDTFAQLIGNSALFNVVVAEYPEGSGSFRDQIDLAFGKGIKPC
jgi:hypothetical protein